MQPRVLPILAKRAAMSFFVTSQTSVTGNLGGLAGADASVNGSLTAVGTNRDLARVSERRT